MYFANNPTEEDAFVLSVDKSRVSVIIPRFGIEGSVSGMSHSLVFHLSVTIRNPALQKSVVGEGSRFCCSQLFKVPALQRVRHREMSEGRS